MKVFLFVACVAQFADLLITAVNTPVLSMPIQHLRYFLVLMFWKTYAVATRNMKDVQLSDYHDDSTCRVKVPFRTESSSVSDKYGGVILLYDYPHRTCNLTVEYVAPVRIAYDSSGNGNILYSLDVKLIPEIVLKERLITQRTDVPVMDDGILVYRSESQGSISHFKTASFFQKMIITIQLEEKPIHYHYNRSASWIFIYHAVLRNYSTDSGMTPAWTFCPRQNGYVHRKLLCNWKNIIACLADIPDIDVHRAQEPLHPVSEAHDDMCKAAHMEEIFHEDFENPRLRSTWRVEFQPEGEIPVLKVINQSFESPQERTNLSVSYPAVRAVVMPVYVWNGLLHIRPGTAFYRITSEFSCNFAEIEMRVKYTMHRVTASIMLVSECDHTGSSPCHREYITLLTKKAWSKDLDKAEIGLSAFVVRENAVRGTFQQLIAKLYHNKQATITDTDSFHVHKVNRSSDSIIWYIDDVPIGRFADPNNIPSGPMNIRFSVDIEKPPPTEDLLLMTRPPAEDFLVDYIIVRQQLAANESAAWNQPTNTADWLWQTSIGIALAAALCIGLAVFLSSRRRRRKRFERTSELSYVPSPIRAVTKARVKELYRSWRIAPQVSALKIPRRAIKFEYKLDEGEFGTIWKATAYRLFDIRTPCAVAVKSVKHYGDEYHHRLLMDEVTVHSQAGRHVNIVNLLGIVLSGQLHIILEYSRYGNLLNFLRDLVNRQVTIGTESGSTLGAEVVGSVELRQIGAISANLPLKVEEMLNFVYQISLGLEYLTHKNIIHMDLAARNILIYDKQILKIGDFGLAKLKSEYYQMAGSEHAMFPIKWMAPESLDEGVYSEKSDVWSFGIVVWEIFSFGKVPYSDILPTTAYVELKSALQDGLRLSLPSYCPQPLSALVYQCWNFHSPGRPTFTRVTREIEPLVAPEQQRHYVELNEPYVAFNSRNSEQDQNERDEMEDHVLSTG